MAPKSSDNQRSNWREQKQSVRKIIIRVIYEAAVNQVWSKAEKQVSYHDAERQNDVAVSGVVQHLNEWLKWKVDRVKGQAKVPGPKQSKPTGFWNVTCEHHLNSAQRRALKGIVTDATKTKPLSSPSLLPHLSRVVRTDGDAKICVDEGVVYQVSHILEGLPIVFADPVREQQLEPQTTAWNAI